MKTKRIRIKKASLILIVFLASSLGKVNACKPKSVFDFARNINQYNLHCGGKFFASSSRNDWSLYELNLMILTITPVRFLRMSFFVAY